MQLDLDRIRTERLDLTLELDLMFVDRNCERVVDCGRDVGVGDGAEQLPVATGLGFDRESRRLQALGQLLSIGQYLRVALLLRLLLRAELRERAAIGLRRELTRQQKVS